MMKYIIIILLFFISYSAAGQGQWNNQAVNTKVNRLKADSVLITPRDTAATNKALNPLTGLPVGDSGRIAYKNGQFWGHYGSAGWNPLASGGTLGGTVDTAHTIENLMNYNGMLNTIIVSEKYRGGVFTYIPASTAPVIDSGIVFPATGKGGGVWYRNWNNSAISATWFGCLPGMADASRGLNKAIETFAATGIAIYFPPGIYRLKDIIIKRNIRLSADQITKSNILDNLTIKILPVIGTTTNVFRFESTAVFSALEHLFIDGDYINSPNLAAAVRMDGYSNLINDVTIVNTADCALSASAPLGGQYGLNSRLEHSSIHGMAAPFQPFTSFNDFHGATQITGGDITITDTEFGANLPYLSINIPPNPADMLRDPINSRIVAFCADILVNAWIYNNFFENGDQGCVIKQGEHNTFYGNRYEMNGTRGLLLKIMQHSTFTGEKFGNNSLAINGHGEDIRLDTGGVAYCDFTNLNFKKFIDLVNIPTSNYKVKFNIVDYGGPGGNSMTSPTFSDTSTLARYDSIGHYDNTAQGVQPRHLEGQTAYKTPTFDGLTIGGNGFRDPWTAIISKGGLDLQPGTIAGSGGFSGMLRFFNQAGTTTGSIGFDAFPGLTFSSTGNATFLTTGMIHANPGGTNLNMISDNTGISKLQFSSDITPTRSALMQFYNANGDFTMSTSRHIYLGLINNLELNINGQNYLRNVPDYAISDTTFSFLVRKKDGGQIQIKAKEYIDSLITASAGGIQNQDAILQTAKFRINGAGTTENGFNVVKDGSYVIDPAFTMYNAASSRAAAWQLNGDTDPGVSLWITDNTGAWTRRLEMDYAGNTVIDGSLTLGGYISNGLFTADGLGGIGSQNIINNGNINTGSISINGVADINGVGQATLPSAIILNSLRYAGGIPGSGKWLQSDGSGNASWQTLTGAISSLNTLTGSAQTFATGNSGTDFNIASVGSVHGFNIPDASATARGVITTGTQTIAGNKNLTGVTTLSTGWTTGSFGFGATASPAVARVNILSANTSGLYVINTSTPSAATGGFVRLINAGTPSADGHRIGGIIAGTNPTGSTYRSSANVEFYADGAAWTDGTSQPTRISFGTTSSGSATITTRMTIGATGLVTMNNGLTVTGNINTGKLIGNSAAPSVTLGAGLTGSVAVIGTDLAGKVTVTITSVGVMATNAEWFTLTYNAAYTSIPHVVFSSASSTTAIQQNFLKNSATNSFQLATSPAIGTVAATTYSWEYSVIQ